MPIRITQYSLAGSYIVFINALALSTTGLILLANLVTLVIDLYILCDTKNTYLVFILNGCLVI
uniref:Uncharacterized protein n=1 Tax=Babesia bovis TaxID=5865 RepID=S6BFZ9_BABBO|nr:hypothetical protein [Babesia bovis]